MMIPFLRNFHLITVILASLVCAEMANGQLIIGDTTKVYDKNLVPTAAVAIRIAEVIAEVVYGEDSISRQKPFVAVEEKDSWIVTGTIPKGFFSRRMGGVVEIELSKKDARVLTISHSK
jgi:hypothetical protein